jgi:hypothetical protein
VKVWREGLEVAIKIKGSQGQRRVVWLKVEHPFKTCEQMRQECLGKGGSFSQ